MSHTNLTRNPFLTPLTLVGTLFCLTAWLYTLLTLRADPSAAQRVSATGPLMHLMREWGVTLLVVELVLLTACVLGALLADRRR